MNRLLRLADRFFRVSRWLNRWVERGICLMGMSMAGIVAVQVFSRYVLNHSLFWSEELARILLVCLSFFGATVAYCREAHPGVDGLFRRLPPRWKPAVRMVTHAASFLLFGVMLVYGTLFAFFVRQQITPALALPKWIFMGVVPLAGALFLVHAAAFFLADLGRLFRQEDA